MKGDSQSKGQACPQCLTRPHLQGEAAMGATLPASVSDRAAALITTLLTVKTKIDTMGCTKVEVRERETRSERERERQCQVFKGPPNTCWHAPPSPQKTQPCCSPADRREGQGAVYRPRCRGQGSHGPAAGRGHQDVPGPGSVWVPVHDPPLLGADHRGAARGGHDQRAYEPEPPGPPQEL